MFDLPTFSHLLDSFCSRAEAARQCHREPRLAAPWRRDQFAPESVRGGPRSNGLGHQASMFGLCFRRGDRPCARRGGKSEVGLGQLKVSGSTVTKPPRFGQILKWLLSGPASTAASFVSARHAGMTTCRPILHEEAPVRKVVCLSVPPGPARAPRPATPRPERDQILPQDAAPSHAQRGCPKTHPDLARPPPPIGAQVGRRRRGGAPPRRSHRPTLTPGGRSRARASRPTPSRAVSPPAAAQRRRCVG